MNPPLTTIGYLSKVHGYKGSLKAELEVFVIEKSQYPEFLWINQHGKPVPFLIEKFSEQDADTFVIKFSDVNSEEQANLLKGETLYCEEALFDEYFEEPESLEYLKDYSVIDSKNGYLGPIIDIMENTFQPNLVVSYQNKEVLIPFTEELIVRIDDKKKEVILHIPDGLLDIYI
jgi:16S rRNA processing protein RimM